ncbi:MAG: hypothetical protein ACK40Z_13555, partial [Dietzia sp.]
PGAGAPAAAAPAGGSAAPGRAATRTRTSVTAQGAAAGTAGSTGQQSAGAAGSGGADTGAGGDAPADGAPAAAIGGTSTAVTAVIEVDRKAARPGGAMGFAAAGFWPGEQVYVVLGEGDAAVGPVLAGVDGEVAGVLVLPEDIAPGTHEIRAAGAGSGLEAAERFPVRTDISPTASAAGLSGSAGWVFLALAALALLAAAAVAVNRRLFSRPDGGAEPEPEPEPEPDGVDEPDDADGEGGAPHQPTTVFEQRDLR